MIIREDAIYGRQSVDRKDSMGCNTLIPAAPFFTAICARRQHFLVLMAPMPKYAGTRPAACSTMIFTPAPTHLPR